VVQRDYQPQISLTIGNLRKHVTAASENDLLRKVRHEKYVLGGMIHEEIFDVLRCRYLTLRVVQEHFLHVEGVHYSDIRGILFDELVSQAERNQADHGWVERIHVEHVKDVIKPQEEQVPWVLIHKAQALQYLTYEKWVCWIFIFGKIRLHIENRIMEAPHIRSDDF